METNQNSVKEGACVPGRYGENCVQNCSVHCAGQDKSCDGTTGACLSGCEPGYGGLACDLDCDSDLVWTNCSEPCEPNCDRSSLMCNTVVDGSCVSDCYAGYKGDKCDEICDPGTYGLDCAERCSEHCRGRANLCDHKTGRCSLACDRGYQGDKCDTAAGYEDTKSSGIIPNVFGRATLFATALLAGSTMFACLLETIRPKSKSLDDDSDDGQPDKDCERCADDDKEHIETDRSPERAIRDSSYSYQSAVDDESYDLDDLFPMVESGSTSLSERR